MRIIWLLCLAMLVCDGVKELFGTVSPNGTVDVIFIQLREITAECLVCVERARFKIEMLPQEYFSARVWLAPRIPASVE